MHERDYRSARSDPTGKSMMFVESQVPELFRVVAAVDGTPIELSQPHVASLGPGAQMWLGRGRGDDAKDIGFFRRGDVRPRFQLSHLPIAETMAFDPNGRFAALETPAGAVAVLDLPKIEQVLEELGLKENP
jgi:hypothetical protein